MVGISTSMIFFVRFLVLSISWRPFRKSYARIPSLHINSFYEFPKTVNVAAIRQPHLLGIEVLQERFPASLVPTLLESLDLLPGELRHGHRFNTVRELTVDAAAGDADEGPEARAHVLRPEAIAVDASAVGRQLEEPPNDPLVPLLLLPGRGRHLRFQSSKQPEEAQKGFGRREARISARLRPQIEHGTRRPRSYST